MPAQMPKGSFLPMCGQGGVRGFTGMAGLRVRMPVFKTPRFYGSFALTGTTLDKTGAALGNCTVDLFHYDAFETLVAATVSNGSGLFTFTLGTNEGNYFARAYIAGTPNRAGITWNYVVVPGSVNIYLRDPTTADSGGVAGAFRVIGSPVIRRISL